MVTPPPFSSEGGATESKRYCKRKHSLCRGGWSRVIAHHQKSCDTIMNIIISQLFPTFLNLALNNDALYKKGAKATRSCPTYLTPTRPRKRVSLRVLDSSPQCKGRLPLLNQDQQVLIPRLRLLLLILVLYPKLDPSPESLLLSGALGASLRHTRLQRICHMIKL